MPEKAAVFRGRRRGVCVKRRDLIALLGGAALPWPLRLDAQPAAPTKIRVGNPSVQSFSFLPLRAI
jgi:hypothetical protein